MERTGAALRALGHDARPAHVWEAGDEVDVVHAFNHGGDIVHAVEHWRRTPAAFVFSPVLVVEPSHEWRTRLGRFVPIPAFPARAIRTLVGKADLTIGLTRWEADLMRELGQVDATRVAVVGNGVDPVVPASDADLPPLPTGPYVVSVGSVSPRKRQLEVALALRDTGIAHVIVGGADAGVTPEQIADAAARTGGTWLGEIVDARILKAIVSRAVAHVQLSLREGQSLAVLEALAAGTPVLASNLPSHRELAQAHPGWLRLIDAPAAVPNAIADLRADPPTTPPPTIATWHDVASQLVEHYRAALTAGARTGQNR